MWKSTEHRVIIIIITIIIIIIIIIIKTTFDSRNFFCLPELLQHVSPFFM